jgi:hypothetical protein
MTEISGYYAPFEGGAKEIEGAAYQTSQKAFTRAVNNIGRSRKAARRVNKPLKCSEKSGVFGMRRLGAVGLSLADVGARSAGCQTSTILNTGLPAPVISEKYVGSGSKRHVRTSGTGILVSDQSCF